MKNVAMYFWEVITGTNKHNKLIVVKAESEFHARQIVTTRTRHKVKQINRICAVEGE